jgi:GH25 family lysozyme M1 (1,4-beta-N-acetylmuramidase)
VKIDKRRLYTVAFLVKTKDFLFFVKSLNVAIVREKMKLKNIMSVLCALSALTVHLPQTAAADTITQHDIPVSEYGTTIAMPMPSALTPALANSDEVSPEETAYHLKMAVLGVLPPEPEDDKYRNNVINTMDIVMAKKYCIEKEKPPKFPTYGIDVSTHQGAIDWKAVKNANFSFAIIRAGYGKDRHLDQVDKRFHANMHGAKQAGLDVGIYWYSYALNEQDALEEARYCIDTVEGYQFEYPLYFDIEEPSQVELGKTEVSKIITTFCDEVKKNGYYPGLYSYKNFLLNNVDEEVLRKYPVWVAQWAEENTYGKEYGIWQYSSTGSVTGVDGNADLNIAYVDYPTVIKSLRMNGY